MVCPWQRLNEIHRLPPAKYQSLPEIPCISQEDARVSVLSVSRRGAASKVARGQALTRSFEAVSSSLNEFES
jgi:hypothetical protein